MSIPLRLSVLLLALSALAAPRSAQFDALSWSFTGCAAVNGDRLTLDLCTASCTASTSQASTVLAQSGVYSTELAWLAQNTCCVELRVGVIHQGVVTTVFSFGSPFGASWCSPSPPPCTGGTAGGPPISFPAQAGDTLFFLLDGLPTGCGSTADVQETQVEFSNLTVAAADPPAILSVQGTNAFEATPVVITGSGFDAATTVSLDGVPEPVVAQTPTTGVGILATVRSFPCYFSACLVTSWDI